MTRLELGQGRDTLTVFAYGRAIELEVVEGETSERVAQRLSALLNASGVTTPTWCRTFWHDSFNGSVSMGWVSRVRMMPTPSRRSATGRRRTPTRG